MSKKINTNSGDHDIARRRMIKALACTPLIVGSMPKASYAAATPSRHLAFQNTHTGEKLALTYFEQGKYIPDALKEVNHVLRDHRTDEVHKIDTSLLDLLHDLHNLLGANKPFQIISGYRSPKSNAMLNKTSSGVAKKSLHMLGQAIDIRLTGVDSSLIRNAAISMKRGGVGYYQASDFVHIDTGRVRRW